MGNVVEVVLFIELSELALGSTHACWHAAVLAQLDADSVAPKSCLCTPFHLNFEWGRCSAAGSHYNLCCYQIRLRPVAWRGGGGVMGTL